MLFSSSIFLFAYLPLLLLCYYNPFYKKAWFKNALLLVASLGFYAWGEPLFVLVMIGSIIFNYLCGYALLIRHSKYILLFNIMGNLSVLFIYKYLGFGVDNLNMLFNLNIDIQKLALPIGISFFTFQAMSYVIDVYCGKAKAQKNIFYLGLYISFFPQLIAGPIVRYVDIEQEIMNRTYDATDFNEGVLRFIMGLAKKVLIANTLATVADVAFNSNIATLSMAMAWLGIIAYTLQIYFDFSGYSDMAIGLGRMFGFHFLENFNYPYIASSITDFWRRWHISLSSWFKDYVYIPLGGNRVKLKRWIINMSVVWLLTGLWHGANWTFICWGLFYLILLVAEKNLNFTKKMGKFSHIYTLLAVMIGWVLFRSNSIGDAFLYLKCMFGFGSKMIDNQFILYFENFIVYFAIGILASLNFKRVLNNAIKKLPPLSSEIVYILSFLFLFFITLIFMIKGTYNPFIYFNF